MSISSDDGYFHVNYGQVNDVYDALNDATRAIGMVLQELQDTVNGLTASWVGASQDAYNQVQRRFNTDLADMQTLLANSRGTLSEMSINYSSTDGNLALGWQEIS